MPEGADYVAIELTSFDVGTTGCKLYLVGTKSREKLGKIVDDDGSLHANVGPAGPKNFYAAESRFARGRVHMTEVRTFGIDISSNSADIDWQKVTHKLNPRFVLARAYHMGENDHASYPDKRFAKDYWPALQQLNIPCGAYVFCNPKADADKSIANFFSVYEPQVGDILPTIDIEDNYDNDSHVPVKTRIAQIEKMIELVSKRIGGQKPMVYTKARVWEDLGNPSQFSDCPLWVMDYQVNPTKPSLPVTWPKFAFW